MKALWAARKAGKPAAKVGKPAKKGFKVEEGRERIRSET
jgi:hypothetical protein